MKIVDTRDNRVMQGILVDRIPANEAVSTDQMRSYYKLTRADRNFDFMAQPCEYERLVLRRTDLEDDDSYYIVPCYPFYEIKEETP